jgi:hypothetical protein
MECSVNHDEVAESVVKVQSVGKWESHTSNLNTINKLIRNSTINTLNRILDCLSGSLLGDEGGGESSWSKRGDARSSAHGGSCEERHCD